MSTDLLVCFGSRVNPILQKAKPFYNYLKVLENITRDTEETDTALRQSREIQQVWKQTSTFI